MKGRPIDWLPEEMAWIEAHKEWPRRQAFTGFCARFLRTDVSFGAFKNLCKRKGWLTGRTGHFPVGVQSGPANNTAFLEAGKATRFRKGNVPHTARGIGHESIDPKDGYVWIIVAEANPHTGAPTRRVMKHRWLWEQANGPVPEGHRLKSLDGNRQNTDPANWEAVPYAIAPRLNGRFGRGYDTAPDEIKPVIMAVAKLEHAAREARRKARA